MAVTADDRKKLIETINERVSLILCPLGITVSYEVLKAGGQDVAEFSFKIPDADKSKAGTYEELIVHLTQNDVYQCHRDPKQLDCLPRAWARICADFAPSLFDTAKMPTADGVTGGRKKRSRKTSTPREAAHSVGTLSESRSRQRAGFFFSAMR